MEEQIERMDDGHNSVRFLKHKLPWKRDIPRFSRKWDVQRSS